MELEERKRLILARQHLTMQGERRAVCRDLNGLQAQFLSNARHALCIRTREPLGERWGEGLVKSWTVRGTMHVFREEDLSLFLHRDRRHFLRDVDQFVDDSSVSAERKRQFAQYILDCIDQGIATREALRTACFAHGMTEAEEESFFNSWGGLLRAMSESGMLCYEVEEEKTFRRCPPFTPMEREEALLEQARRYFTHYGPAAVRDAAYYFGMPQKTVKGWLDRLPVTAVSCGGRDCYFIDDGHRGAPELPDCVLLAGFDPLLLGYEKRDGLFLPPEYIRGIFSRAGIVFPAVLLDGTVAGRWKCSGTKGTVTLFRPVTSREQDAICREVSRWRPEVKTLIWEQA